MQSSQSTDEKTQDATEQPLNADQWQDHLAKLSDYGKQLYIDYREQTGTCKKLAAAEWRLSTRSLALTIILLVCFAGGLVYFGLVYLLLSVSQYLALANHCG